jgi:plasmid rolling circle replication initiator protein Rep
VPKKARSVLNKEFEKKIMCDDMLAKFVIDFLCIILFFSMDFLLLDNKKPLFCDIIKLQDKIKKQNRGVLYMLFYKNSLKHTAIKSNTLNLHVVNKLEQVAQQVIHKKAVAKAVAKREAEPPVQQPTGEKLVDYSQTGKKRKWDKHKQDALKLADLYTQALKLYPNLLTAKRLEDLILCAEQLEYLVDADGNKKLYRTYFCRNRLCPMCQWRRSLKLFSQVSKITDYLNEQNNEQNNQVRYLFITLTQKNCEGANLKIEFDKINTAFAKLVDKTKHVATATKFKQSMLGYIKSTEVTYNSKTNTYHPHLHVIFAVKEDYFNFKSSNYISKNNWRAIWAELLGVDYLPQVNVQAIKQARQQKAVAELAKYPAKITNILDLPQQQAVQVVADLTIFCYKRRFVAFGGIFKKTKTLLKLQDVEAENADLVGAGNIKEFNYVARAIYKYNVKFGCYISS